MWAITGTPASVSSRTCGSIGSPPSSLTACAPASFMNRTDVSKACSGDRWYEPNGRSATTSARLTERVTARASGMSSSTVTGREVSLP